MPTWKTKRIWQYNIGMDVREVGSGMRDGWNWLKIEFSGKPWYKRC
jgi:hypothetical protein